MLLPHGQAKIKSRFLKNKFCYHAEKNNIIEDRGLKLKNIIDDYQ